jgi:hypothetical protein
MSVQNLFFNLRLRCPKMALNVVAAWRRRACHYTNNASKYLIFNIFITRGKARLRQTVPLYAGEKLSNQEFFSYD